MTSSETGNALGTLAAAASEGWIGPTAEKNIRRWLTDPRYERLAPQLIEHLSARRWDTLNDVFWTTVPFGTAGRRGRMYPIGCNAINEQTIGETAQALADYVLSLRRDANPRCAVAFDTRHRSLDFAHLCCEVMAAAGFQVYFLQNHRSTPELAYAVRHYHCLCGIMITASHNPPEDNAIKVFWSNGGQLQAPRDEDVLRCISNIAQIDRMPLSEARTRHRIVDACRELDELFQRAVLAHGFPGGRDLTILYSPLHGTGTTSVLTVLRRDGFERIEVFAPQAEPHGDFPNVPGHIANPENPAVFDDLIKHSQEIDADLALASDPDGDRIGCAARLTPDGAWRALSGNQIAVLLAAFILRKRQAAQTLSSEHYMVTTLVTTPMLASLAGYYGLRMFDNVLTGFKWMGGIIDEQGPERFVFAAEEAHGYLVGPYIRDKDAAGAAMLLAELAAQCRQEGKTLHQELDRLYEMVGYHAEAAFSRTFPGSAGVQGMQSAMHRLRERPPSELAGMKVVRIRDYLHDRAIRPRSRGSLVDDKECDLLFFDLEMPGNSVAVRPSGTEPKLKFYFFARRELDASGMHPQLRSEVAEQLLRMRDDILAAAGIQA